MTTNHWQGKTALITGASYGIGEAFAQRLAREGANLILTARSIDRLNTLADQLRAQHRANVTVIAGDLAQPDAARALFDETERREMIVDLLINNAGFGVIGKFIEQPLDRQLEMMQVNITALVELTYLYLQRMVARRDGAIIQVASTASFQGVPYFTVYAATKAFVMSFSEGLWGECEAANVRVMALCPGPTATHFQAVAGTADIRDPKQMQTPEEVVDYGLRALAQRRSVAVSGFRNRAMVFGERFVPRSTVTRLAMKMYEAMARQKR